MNSPFFGSSVNKGLKKVTEFAPILEVSASHITAVTDALVEKEWITRIRSKEDRRIIAFISLKRAKKSFSTLTRKKRNISLNALTATLMLNLPR